MNGRVSTLIYHAFSDKSERRRFKKAYMKLSDEGKKEVVKVATKINNVRKNGGQVKNFVIDQTTHQMKELSGNGASSE